MRECRSDADSPRARRGKSLLRERENSDRRRAVPEPVFLRVPDEAVPQVPRQLAGFANDSLSLNRL